MKSKDKRLEEADALLKETYIAIRHLKGMYNQNQNGYRKTAELMNRIQIWRSEHRGASIETQFQQELQAVPITTKCQQSIKQEKIWQPAKLKLRM